MQAILFDADGVLINAPQWSDEYCRRSGISPTIMRPFFQWIFQDCILGKADMKDSLSPFLREWRWTGTVEEYLHEWFDFENQPDMRLIEAIQKLRHSGIKCYIATNQERYRLDYLRKSMWFESFFDGIFSSCEMGMKKPESSFYQYCTHSLWVPAHDILYFDDAGENIDSAKTLWIQSVLYRDLEDFTITLHRA